MLVEVSHQLDRTPDMLERVFDGIPDVLYYIKDTQARYISVNQTLVARSGLARDDVIRKTADQLFPVTGASTNAQDLSIIENAFSHRRSAAPLLRRNGASILVPELQVSGTQRRRASNRIDRYIARPASTWRASLRLPAFARISGLSGTELGTEHPDHRSGAARLNICRHPRTSDP